MNTIPGVGKKTAERLILELRDKMPEIAAYDDGALREETDPTSSLGEDLISALVNLGFPRPSSEKAALAAVREAPDLSFEDALKKVLRELSG